MVLQQVKWDENEIQFASRLVIEKRVNGIIFLGGSFLWTSDEIEKIGVPFVFLTTTLSKCDKKTFSSVCIDDVKEAQKVTEYLLELGHRKIVLLVSDAFNHSVAELRLNGYKNALKKFSVQYNEELIAFAEAYNMESGYKALMGKLKKKIEFTAVFAISDTLAVGAMRAIKDSGLKVPDDISVFGFDGQDISMFYNPTISTIKQPFVEMAECSVKQLFSLLNRKENKQVFFDGILSIGESSSSIK